MPIQADALGVFRAPDGSYIEVKPDHYLHSHAVSSKNPTGFVQVHVAAPNEMTTVDGVWKWRYSQNTGMWKVTGDVVMLSVLCIDQDVRDTPPFLLLFLSPFWSCLLVILLIEEEVNTM